MCVTVHHWLYRRHGGEQNVWLFEVLFIDVQKIYSALSWLEVSSLGSKVVLAFGHLGACSLSQCVVYNYVGMY